MKIVLEQLFYGRGARGYGILGASPGAENFAARVESLCGAVGTPGGDYGGEPFLISVPEGEYAIMLCGRRGAPDSMGRATLFFHALAANKAEMAKAKADAFSLFEQGAFNNKMPQGAVKAVDLHIDAQTRRPPDNLRIDAQMRLPAVIRSSSPVQGIVREVACDRALDLAWATFAFQALQGFDIQVLSPRTSIPRTLNEYDASGKLLRAAAAGERPLNRPPMDGRTQCEAQGRVQPPHRSSAMLKFSLAVNVVLAVLLAAVFAQREHAPSGKTNPERIVVTNVVEKLVEKPVAVQLSDAQKSAIEEAAIARFRSDFPGGSKEAFLQYHENAVNLFSKYYGPDYDCSSEANKAQFEQQHEFLDKLETGIDFVNKNLLKGGKP